MAVGDVFQKRVHAQEEKQSNSKIVLKIVIGDDFWERVHVAIGREQSNSKIGDEYISGRYFWKRVHAYYAE